MTVRSARKQISPDTEHRRQRRAHRAANLARATAPDAERGLAMADLPGASGAPTTNEAGVLAEDRAAELLARKGYEIAERNYRCDIGELDIVALDGTTLVFVEVRSRADAEHGDAVESVNVRKQNKVRQVAEIYLADRRPDFDECRFDVVAINGPTDADVTHYDDAWRGGLL